MSINLTQLIAEIEAAANAASASTSITDLVKIAMAADKVGGGFINYDSAGALPTGDSDYLGMTAYRSDTQAMYVYNGNQWDLLDSSSVEFVIPYNYIGNNFGYVAGARSNGAPSLGSNHIEKYSFTSDGNSWDMGDLWSTVKLAAGTSSLTHGYTAGGYALPQPSYNIIMKFPFANYSTGTVAGNLTVGRYWTAGVTSYVSGYTVGGYQPAVGTVIDKFPFAADGNATDVGDLLARRIHAATNQSRENGYIMGSGGGNTGQIQKFSLASDGNAAYSGAFTTGGARHKAAGVSSFTDGYFTGGNFTTSPETNSNIIDKFPFASDGVSADVGDTIGELLQHTATSGSTHGYIAGGWLIPYLIIGASHIQKFQYASSSNSVSVGGLFHSGGGPRQEATGHQV